MEYIDYTDVFSLDLVMELIENTNINKHAIKLVEDKQPSYKLIYSLSWVKPKIFKAYIKIHLKLEFIWPSKSLADTFILFDKKLDGNLWLFINYWGLNNLTIKNWYSLLIIIKFLD